MKLTILTVDDNEHIIENVDEETVLPLIEAFAAEDEPVLSLRFDEAMCYFLKRNIVMLAVE